MGLCLPLPYFFFLFNYLEKKKVGGPGRAAVDGAGWIVEKPAMFVEFRAVAVDRFPSPIKDLAVKVPLIHGFFTVPVLRHDGKSPRRPGAGPLAVPGPTIAAAGKHIMYTLTCNIH